VENKDVSKLSERQRKKLTTKARKLDVTIKFEDRIQRIVVRGDPDDVSVIINDIWEEIQERSKKENDSEQAKVLYKTIKWQYESHGISHFFNKSSNAVIEKAHANKDTRVTVEVEGENYIIIFAQSTGTGLSSGQTISVTRTTVGSSAGHNEGTQYVALRFLFIHARNTFSFG
jgi:ABC-type molybdate transport system ATPase subunit